jgi:hypothetical protein
MSVAKRVSEEMGVELGKEVRGTHAWTRLVTLPPFTSHSHVARHTPIPLTHHV